MHQTNKFECITIWLNLFADLYSEEEEMEAQDEFEVIEVAPNRYKTIFHAPQ